MRGFISGGLIPGDTTGAELAVSSILLRSWCPLAGQVSPGRLHQACLTQGLTHAFHSSFYYVTQNVLSVAMSTGAVHTDVSACRVHFCKMGAVQLDFPPTPGWGWGATAHAMDAHKEVREQIEGVALAFYQVGF